MSLLDKVLGHFKQELQLTKEYHESFSEKQDIIAIEPQKKSKPKPAQQKENKKCWPYDNNVDIADLTMDEQRERVSRIEMYMEEYPFLPFTISDSFLYRPNTSWTCINMGGREVVFQALRELNDLVIDFQVNEKVLHELLPYDISIPYSKICFDHSGIPGKPARSFIEYWPFTTGGYRRTEPLIVHFTTIKEAISFLDDDCSGELVYGVDGSVVSAKVNIFKSNKCYSYSFGLAGRTFTIGKITTPSKTGKQIVIYSSSWDFMEC